MKIAVVIPAYRVVKHVLGVIEKIPADVSTIYVVDDACPDGSGRFVEKNCRDPRVKVLFQPANSGVGGATVRGLEEARSSGHQIAVKLDGDGQMDPNLLPKVVAPIRAGQADFAKGNRFHSPASLAGMPTVRIIGNAGLSLCAKAMTGYWNLMDPTNGYFAVHLSLLPELETRKLARRYFFESDLLFRLSLVRAVVRDIPIPARYGDEVSHLSVTNALFSFPPRLLARCLKRIFYQYFLRDFNLGSVFLLVGSLLCFAGMAFGAWHWFLSFTTGHAASSGTVMLAALPTMIGLQMLTFALVFDVLMIPRSPLHPTLE